MCLCSQNEGTYELFRFRLSQDLARYTTELAQRGHRAPHASFGHLAHIKRCSCGDGPAALEADLEHGTENTVKLTVSGVMNIMRLIAHRPADCVT
jgi:hypothetical protein